MAADTAEGEVRGKRKRHMRSPGTPHGCCATLHAASPRASLALMRVNALRIHTSHSRAWSLSTRHAGRRMPGTQA